MRRRLFFLFTCLVAGLLRAGSQPYVDVRTFSLRDGLAANVISSIGQTADGLMWFGTWSGLCYFDGYRFTTYRDDPGSGAVLSSNRIATIHPNSRGDVYVITYDGHVYLFDTHQCKYVNIENLLPQNQRKSVRFRHISSLADGYTLVTGDNTTFALKLKDDDIEGKGGVQVVKADEKRQGKGGKVKTFTDSRHRTWIFAGNDGVLLTDGAKTVKLQAEPRISSERTTSSVPFIFEDDNHTVWVVPKGGTFSYYDEQSHALVPYPLHAGEAAVASIPLIKRFFVDSQHNVWFAGERNLTLLKFRHRIVNRIPMVVNQEVRSLCVDRQGNIWAGDHEGALAVYDKAGKLRGFVSPAGSLQPEPVAFSKSVYSMLQDRKGRVWIGTKFDGLYLLGGGRLTHFSHDARNPYSLSHEDVYDIIQDSRGRIWIATYGGGVNLVDESTGSVRFLNVNNVFSSYPRKTFLKSRRITETRQGVFIVSSNGGLVTFSGNFKSPRSIRFYTTSHRPDDSSSLASNTVFQTLVTRSGRLFVNIMGGGMQEITDKNLLHDNLRLKTVSGVTADEGLVQAMVEDRDGGVWLVRETTIDKYDVANGVLYTFSPADIGYNVEFSEAKPLCTADGRILMACNGSFISFSPRDFIKSSFVPKIVFTSVQFQGEDKPVSILNTAELDVPSDKRSLTIFFSALDYSDNGLIRYAYKLEGSDDKWNFVDAGHSASFNRIPHGHLKLLVRSTNNNGIWQDNVRELRIYAHPTFWESWMGWLLYILIGGGLIALAMYIYAQQQRIKMQTELEIMRTDFFTSIGHKLRTPLTLIGGPVKEVLDSEKLTEKGSELLDMVRRNSQNMLDLVNSMLNYEHNPDNYLVDDEHTQNPTHSPSTTGRGAAKTFDKNKDSESKDNDSSNKDVGSVGSAFDLKLLVVEDNRDLRRFLFSILSSDYSVIVAENGQEGLEKARSEMPDFIISDVMMPVMDGLTMVHNLKQDKATSHIPIIILSAKASMQDRLQGLREGIDDYITKPFSATYLKERVANIIARRKSLQQEVLAQLSHFKDEERVESEEERVESREERIESGEERDMSQDNQEGNHKAQTSNLKPQTSNLNPQTNEYRLSSPVIIDEDKVLMEKLMAYLEKNIDNPDLKVEELAQAVNLSRTVFYGKIKSIVGMPPIEFVRHIRLQRAEELIVKSKESFSQIAYAVGFSDPKYFSRCFKKETGMLPSEYRAKAAAK